MLQKYLSYSQVIFLQALMRSLHCHEPAQNQILIVPLLAQMITKENYDAKVNKFGWLISCQWTFKVAEPTYTEKLILIVVFDLLSNLKIDTFF